MAGGITVARFLRALGINSEPVGTYFLLACADDTKVGIEIERDEQLRRQRERNGVGP